MADKAPKVPQMGPPAVPMAVADELLSEAEVSGGDRRKRKGKSLPTVRIERLQSTCDSGDALEEDLRMPKRVRRAKVTTGVGGGVGQGAAAEMKAITADLLDLLLREGLPRSVVGEVVGQIGRYEEVLVRVLLESERMRGKVEAYEKVSVVSGVKGAGARSSNVVSAPLGPAAKPAETWSVVVRSKDAASTPKDVVAKVVEEVGPALGVRVHGVKPVKGKGAVIRTPSVAERDRIANNRKFDEVGLVVSVSERVRPRVVVSGMQSEISPAEFMDDLYEMNLKDVMAREEFDRSVRITSRPWEVGSGRPVTVVIEGCEKVVSELLAAGRAYVKWFSFPVREYERVNVCHRCLAPGHFVRECRMRSDVCRRCGGQDHSMRDCVNEVSCRNCVFKGRPSGHLMNSGACPLYRELVERMNARH